MKRNTKELKEKMIKAGIVQIKNHGLDKLSLRTVAKTCGVTHGSPYKHFESKDGYLRVVLARLSQLFNEELSKNLHDSLSARQQLEQMGFDFVIFAQSNPQIFEALFIKYPFNYLEVTTETLATRVDLPGFDSFKNLVIKLREEENLTSNERDTLIHFWSFISGLSIFTSNQISGDISSVAIRETIGKILDIYIKGDQP